MNHSLLEVVFEFALAYLVGNACMLLMISEVKSVKGDVMTYVKIYKFTITKDWWDINKLPLCQGLSVLKW